jgi:hypothetical protein
VKRASSRAVNSSKARRGGGEQAIAASEQLQALARPQNGSAVIATPSFATSTPARAKTPTLIMKEVGRSISADGTERRLNELQFEGMELAEGRKALSESLGIEEESLHSMLGELAGVTQGRSEPVDCTNLNYAVALMRGLGPKDHLETMLAAQMTVTHMAVMSEASFLRHATTPKTRDLHERTFNKLARTFTTQMAALKNHRAPHGQQKMIVEHVNVHEGGQAIVGQVERDRGAV